MTIDEAIAHAREVTEDNRSAVDSFLVDDYKQREMCEQCAEEHAQLAEWLEELKAIKESAVFYSNSPIEDIVLEGRADAINAIKNDLHERVTEEINRAYPNQDLCAGLLYAIHRCDWYLSDDKQIDE